jgi:hypothetical protein
MESYITYRGKIKNYHQIQLCYYSTTELENIIAWLDANIKWFIYDNGFKIGNSDNICRIVNSFFIYIDDDAYILFKMVWM